MHKPYELQAVDWIAYHAYATPNTTATIDLASGRRQTYAQMNDRVGRLAAYLLDLGVEPNDRVGFIGLNSSDILDMIMATWRIGGISLALNFRLTPPELGFILNDADPKVVFADTTFKLLTDAVMADTNVTHWIDFDGVGGDSTLEREIVKYDPIPDYIVKRDLDDQALLMYSSGTTGMPKGVIITHKQVMFSSIGASGPSGVTRDTVALAAMPIFHIGALNVSCLPMLMVGATTVLMRMFGPAAMLDLIDDAELGITSIFAVSSAYIALRMMPNAETTDYSRIRQAYAGAETVPPALVQWWADKGIILQEGWAMTETCAAGCMLVAEYVKEKPGSAGKPFMGTKIRIVDVDSGKEMGPNQHGEIQIMGPVVTPGYWNRPDADAEAFVDGWFRTGDIGRLDEDGFLYIEDRLKDMYISGGENVYPAEVESVLFNVDGIRELAIIGVPDARFGETGCAVVALRDGAEMSVEKLQTACEGKLAKFKWPNHLVVLPELPRNATGKVLKFGLRKAIPSQLAETA